jgi:hypothetical protein
MVGQMTKLFVGFVGLTFALVSPTLVHGQTLKPIPGAPQEMLGYFGASPRECRSWNRNVDAVTHITKDSMTFCGGSACEARIKSHLQTKDGFRLNFTSSGNPKGWSFIYRMVSPDIFEIQYKDRAPETLVRCSERDIIAGIGRQPVAEMNVSKGYETLFAAYYAKAIPGSCPRLKADTKKIDEIIEIGGLAVYKFRLNDRVNPVPMSRLDQVVEEAKVFAARDAMYAVEEDAKALPAFCEHVTERFGPEGTVIPRLVIDPRARA